MAPMICFADSKRDVWGYDASKWSKQLLQKALDKVDKADRVILSCAESPGPHLWQQVARLDDNVLTSAANALMTTMVGLPSASWHVAIGCSSLVTHALQLLLELHARPSSDGGSDGGDGKSLNRRRLDAIFRMYSRRTVKELEAVRKLLSLVGSVWYQAADAMAHLCRDAQTHTTSSRLRSERLHQGPPRSLEAQVEAALMELVPTEPFTTLMAAVCTIQRSPQRRQCLLLAQIAHAAASTLASLLRFTAECAPLAEILRGQLEQLQPVPLLCIEINHERQAGQPAQADRLAHTLATACTTCYAHAPRVAAEAAAPPPSQVAPMPALLSVSAVGRALLDTVESMGQNGQNALLSTEYSDGLPLPSNTTVLDGLLKWLQANGSGSAISSSSSISLGIGSDLSIFEFKVSRKQMVALHCCAARLATSCDVAQTLCELTEAMMMHDPGEEAEGYSRAAGIADLVAERLGAPTNLSLRGVKMCMRLVKFLLLPRAATAELLACPWGREVARTSRTVTKCEGELRRRWGACLARGARRPPLLSLLELGVEGLAETCEVAVLLWRQSWPEDGRPRDVTLRQALSVVATTRKVLCALARAMLKLQGDLTCADQLQKMLRLRCPINGVRPDLVNYQPPITPHEQRRLSDGAFAVFVAVSELARGGASLESRDGESDDDAARADDALLRCAALQLLPPIVVLLKTQLYFDSSWPATSMLRSLLEWWGALVLDGGSGGTGSEPAGRDSGSSSSSGRPAGTTAGSSAGPACSPSCQRRDTLASVQFHPMRPLVPLEHSTHVDGVRDVILDLLFHLLFQALAWAGPLQRGRAATVDEYCTLVTAVVLFERLLLEGREARFFKQLSRQMLTAALQDVLRRPEFLQELDDDGGGGDDGGVLGREVRATLRRSWRCRRDVAGCPVDGSARTLVLRALDLMSERIAEEPIEMEVTGAYLGAGYAAPDMSWRVVRHPPDTPLHSWDACMLEAAALLPSLPLNDDGVDVARAVGCWCRGCTNLSGGSEVELRLQCCGRCGVARYCSTACQRRAWRAGHREACQEWRYDVYNSIGFAM